MEQTYTPTAAGPLDVEGSEPTPAELHCIPGTVDQIMDLTAAGSKYQNEQLAFAGALAGFSTILARQVCTRSGLRPNLYIVGLGHSGVGKDAPRRTNRALFEALGIGDLIHDRFASGEGLQDELLQHPVVLAQTDEIGLLLEALKRDTTGARLSLISELLQLYSSAGSDYRTRSKAGQPGQVIHQPHVCLLGTATPDTFWQGFSGGLTRNGFMARLLVIEAGPRGERQEPEIVQIPPDLVQRLRRWVKIDPEDNPRPRIVRPGRVAADVLSMAEDQFDQEWDHADQTCNAAAASVWGRAGELMQKLSLVYTMSSDPGGAEISEAAAWWSYEFTLRHARRLLFKAARHVSENAFDEQLLKLLGLLRDSPGRSMGHGDLLKRMHCRAQDFREYVEVLQETGRIRAEKVGRGTTYGIL